MEPTKSYNKTARVLHWVSAVLFILALIIGLYFSTLDFRNSRDDYEKFLLWIHWHKTLGVLVLLLVFFRIYNRIKTPAPIFPETMTPFTRGAAWVSHFSLYALIVFLGVSGLVGSDIGDYSVRLFEVWIVPQFLSDDRELADKILNVHAWAGDISAIFVFIHIGASLYHHYILKDNILKRMTSGD